MAGKKIGGVMSGNIPMSGGGKLGKAASPKGGKGIGLGKSTKKGK